VWQKREEERSSLKNPAADDVTIKGDRGETAKRPLEKGKCLEGNTKEKEISKIANQEIPGSRANELGNK